jgi:hypothetical protein
MSGITGIVLGAGLPPAVGSCSLNLWQGPRKGASEGDFPVSGCVGTESAGEIWHL